MPSHHHHARPRPRCAANKASSVVIVIVAVIAIAIDIAIAIAASGTAGTVAVAVAVGDAFTPHYSYSRAQRSPRSKAAGGGSTTIGTRKDDDFPTRTRLQFKYQDSVVDYEHDPTRGEGTDDDAAATTPAVVSTVPVSFYDNSSTSKPDSSSSSSSSNKKKEDKDTAYGKSTSSSVSVSVSVERYNKMSVTELKRMLIDRGIDFRDCIEKRDLVERLLENYDNNNHHDAFNHDDYVDDEVGGGDGAIDVDDEGIDRYTFKTAANSFPKKTYRRRRSSRLMDSELSLIETFKRVSPCVANIQTTVTTAVSNGLQLKPLEVPLGTGSGFLWDSDGHVVTNYHVVSAGQRKNAARQQLPKTVKVKLSGMTQAVDADVVGVEPEKDLAVLKVRLSRSSLRKLPRPIEIGTSNDLQVGQTVLAIGNPFGLDDTLTKGIVSAVGRDVDGIGGRPIHNCIQTDAAINQGNSGGPLLDSTGRLIGVNTAIFSPSAASGGVAGNVGIGFAIPVDTVRRVVNQIIKYGKVIRPTLGISVVDDRLKRSMEQQLGLELKGCLVAQVVPNSPAVVAGIEATRMVGSRLELGDLITEIDGQSVENAEDLISAVEEKHDGDVVTLRVQRNLSSSSSSSSYKRVKLTTRDELESSTSTTAASTQFRRSRNGTTGRRGTTGTGSSGSSTGSSWNIPWQ